MRIEPTPRRVRAAAAVAALTLGLAGLAEVLNAPVVVLQVIAIAGWFVAAPLVALFGPPGDISEWSFGEDGAADQADDIEDPLEILQERYARGELSEAEFERKAQQLLETNADGESDPLLDDRSQSERYTRRDSDQTDRETLTEF